MSRYGCVVAAALFLCGCANHTPATSFDSGHSVAYNTVHAIGLDVADASAPSNGARAVINSTVGAAAGYAVGGVVMGGAGFLSGIDTFPKTSAYVFGWVPVSTASTEAAARRIVETTFLTALATEVGGGSRMRWRS